MTKLNFYRTALAATVSVMAFGLTSAYAAEPESCGTVRFSDVGWTDITATTATASVDPQRPWLRDRHQGSVRSGHLPVAEEQGHRRLPRQLDADAWKPTCSPSSTTSRSSRSAPNLEGAKYTLATNAKGAELGIKDFADIAKHKDALDGKIYGIEPGNDGNRLIIDMIDKDDKFGLKGFEVVESLRAGHAGAGRPRRKGRPADRLPRLGAASDERQLQADLPHRRRRHLRPELSAARRSTPTCAPATSPNARMSASFSRT